MITVENTGFETKQKIIQDWDFSRLEAYVLKDYPELAKELPDLLRQYKDFLILSSLVDMPLAVPGEKVDIVWHHHLCLNRDYNLLTKKLTGRILRHEPHLDGDATDNQSKKNLIRASFEIFGKFVFDPNFIEHKNAYSGCDCRLCDLNCSTECLACALS